MVNFCLSNEEKALLKSLIGKKLINFRHDPLDKLGKETVYGRIELFFNDSIVLLDYGYKPYPLFGNEDDDHPMFLAKIIDNIFPLSPNKTKRILIVPQEDENPFSSYMPKKGPTLYEKIKDKLEKEGFEVTIFESLMDKAKKLPPNEAMGIIMNVYNNKTPIKDLTSNYDLVIQFAHFDSHNTVQRISWKLSKGTADIPWYVYELPVIFVSLCSPFHLFDVPQVKTYINCYDKKEDTIDSLIEKMMGRSKFKGVSPVDAFCNNLDCRY